MSDKETWTKLGEDTIEQDEIFHPTKLVLYLLGHRPVDYGHLYTSDGLVERCYQYAEFSIIPVPALLSRPDCERVARLLGLPLETKEGPKA